MHTLITCLLAGGALCGIGYCWGWRNRSRAVFGVPKMYNPPPPPEHMPNNLPRFKGPLPPPLHDITAKQCEVCAHLIDCNDKWCFYPNNDLCQRRINKTAKNSKNLLN